MKPKTEYGDVYTIKEFRKMVIDGTVSTYDGFGYFHDGEKEVDLSVWDENLTAEDIEKYKFVIWYNK